MYRLTALYNTPQDREHFRSHLLNVHLPIVSRFPGLRALRVGFDPSANLEQPPYFAIVECDFDDQAALQRALTSEAGREAAADVPNYAQAGFVILTCDIANFPLP